jgi:uncharacterized protein with LGFP repeats
VLCRAISCTPPWKWANCSTASATDNFTVSHTAPCLPGWSDIEARYTEIGSQGSPLGATVGAVDKTTHGHIQHYSHGRMYWTANTGAKYLTGHVLDRYRLLGELTSPLGPPISDVGPTKDRQGSRAIFADGGIYQLDSHGAHAVWGAVSTKWHASGGVTGSLGYPIADQTRAPGRTGQLAPFQHGLVVAGNGLAAHVLLGDIAAKYTSLGGDRVLGYPVADQAAVLNSHQRSGAEVRCQRGAVVAATGEPAFGVWGPIHTAWRSAGAVTGSLGYPTSDVTDVKLKDGPGQQCTFGGGTATYDATTGRVTIVAASLQ